MNGQVAGPMTFDVTKLEARETPAAIAPSTIVPVGVPFYLGATFEGHGNVWDNLKVNRMQYSVAYFAERIGADIGPEKDEIDFLPPATGTLDPAKDIYGPPETEQSVVIKDPGVYRIACVVTFPMWRGLVGFHEELIIQAYVP